MHGENGSMASDHDARSGEDVDQQISEQILAMVTARGAGKTICPSEVARTVRPDDWRQLMKKVRQSAIRLADGGAISIYRKGKPIPTDQVRGVIRLGLPAPQ